MGLIEATPVELSRTGAEIEGIAPSLSALTCLASGAAGHVSQPQATAAALNALGAKYTRAAQRLETDVAALGRALGASAVAYRVTDERAMGGGG